MLVTWPGLIMDIPLGIGGILAHATRNHGDREIVSRDGDRDLSLYILPTSATAARSSRTPSRVWESAPVIASQALRGIRTGISSFTTARRHPASFCTPRTSGYSQIKSHM